MAAAASVVKRLKNCLDHDVVDYSEFSMDPHAVAGGDVSALSLSRFPLSGVSVVGALPRL